MMKPLFVTAALLSTLTVYSQSNSQGEKRIENCSDAYSEAVCVGKILNRKMNRILKRLDNGGKTSSASNLITADIIFADNNDCTGDKVHGVILAKDIDEARSQCRKVANSFGPYANIDGIKINGTCKNIDNSNDYNLGSLEDICLSNTLKAAGIIN